MRVQIAIDNYDDLFSDFDIREYKVRYISSDFLNELRMRTNKILSNKGIEICLCLPKEERNDEHEKIIAKRLKGFFQIRHERNLNKKINILLRAIVFEIIGILFLFIALFFSKYTFEYFKEFMLIPSWFFVWNGLEKYFDHRKIVYKNISYYSMIRKSQIKFESIN